jgi:hypothetical protein
VSTEGPATRGGGQITDYRLCTPAAREGKAARSERHAADETRSRGKQRQRGQRGVESGGAGAASTRRRYLCLLKEKLLLRKLLHAVQIGAGVVRVVPRLLGARAALPVPKFILPVQLLRIAATNVQASFPWLRHITRVGSPWEKFFSRERTRGKGQL